MREAPDARDIEDTGTHGLRFLQDLPDFQLTVRGKLTGTRLTKPSWLKTGATDRPVTKPDLLITKQPHLIVCLRYTPINFNQKPPQITSFDSLLILTIPPLRNVVTASQEMNYLLYISVIY